MYNSPHIDRTKPWNPLESGVVLFNTKTKEIVKEIPFFSIDVYANKNDDYFIYDLNNGKWGLSTLGASGSNLFSHFGSISRIPKEIQVMAMLLKG